MSDPSHASGYRWVVLGAFMAINLMMQVFWITFAPITGPAMQFYGVSELAIGGLAMSFSIAFLPLSMPASWAIDTFGFRRSVTFGALVMGVFGVVRGLAGSSYPVLFASTVALGIAQPFLLNSWTKLAANWFGPAERATAIGLITLANLAGVAVGMAATPLLAESMSIPHVQLLFGGAGAVAALLFAVLARDPPAGEARERALMLDGLKHAFTVRDFLLLLFVSFVGIGIFNGLSTWVEDIVRPRHFTPTDAGALGALMLGGGLVGALVLPALSDRQGTRKRWMMVGILGAIPFVLGVAWADTFWTLAVAWAGLGFFLTGILPVAMQYAAEITVPTPEGTSNGLMQLFGQSSVVFVFLMAAMKTADGSYTPSLLLSAAMLLVSGGVLAVMRDPPTKAPQVVQPTV